MVDTSLKAESFGLSDPGLVRETNEDAWQALIEKGVFVLADGMGGHQAGEVASKDAVSQLCEYLSQMDIHEKALKATIQKVNQYIYQRGQDDEALSGMGTTLCCLCLSGDEIYLAHVGDSRIYRWRDSDLELLTEDHSLLNELLMIGDLKKDEADSFPYKHILTKALGTHPFVEPTVQSFPLLQGDLFLLCSDGLTNYVDEKEITEILLRKESLQRKGKRLIALAKEHGGGDNITVLLVNVLENKV